MLSTLVAVLLFCLITIILIFIQKSICNKWNKYWFILPCICFIYAFYTGIPYIEESFKIVFSVTAFIASLIYIAVLNIPTVALIYVSKKVTC